MATNERFLRLPLPLPPPPEEERREKCEKEPQRGVIIIDLYGDSSEDEKGN